MGKRKSVRIKILDYLSKPRSGQWTEAPALARYLKEPLETVEFYICRLTDEGLVHGVQDEESEDYWVMNLWQKEEWIITFEDLEEPTSDQGLDSDPS